MAMRNVAFIRPELAKLLPLYTLIRDCLAGEPTIKEAKTIYLPRPNAEDVSKENLARYVAYVLRAVFYNVTRRTLSGLVGQIFMRDPVIKVPALLDSVVADATGSGVDLIQQAKKAVSLTLAYSRSGVFVDYPQASQAATIADLESGNIRPVIKVYAPHEIVNWRVIDIGAKQVISLLVIYEGWPCFDDGFEIKTSPQFRVLKLDDSGNYVQEIWREPTPTTYNEKKYPKGNFKMHETLFMLGSDGLPLKEIPFSFIGTENNDTNPDNPNMYDLASINIAHYRNSADYEEACFIVGQPTPVLTGLTDEWFDKVLKGCVNFGSRGGIPLPVGADAKLLQATENTMIKEAMETKERQMVALGAKLVEQKQVQRTAFETKVEATSEGSVLSSCAKNVSTVFEWALEWCAAFIGQEGAEIKFELNSDFDIARMTPEEQNQAITNWQKGATTFTEMRDALRKAGAATEEDEKAKVEILADQTAQLKLTQQFTTPPIGATK